MPRCTRTKKKKKKRKPVMQKKLLGSEGPEGRDGWRGTRRQGAAKEENTKRDGCDEITSRHTQTESIDA